MTANNQVAVEVPESGRNPETPGNAFAREKASLILKKLLSAILS